METVVFYNNMTSYGKGFDEFYNKARSLGVRYIIGRPFDVVEDPETKNLSLRYEDVVNGTIEDMEVDMLVLSSGLEANERNRRLAKACLLYTSPSPRDRTRSR